MKRDDDIIRKRVRKYQKRGLDKLGLDQAEHMLDLLQVIQAKRVHQYRTNEDAMEKALTANDLGLALKCYANCFALNSVIEVPEEEDMDWRSLLVQINGTLYLFPQFD